MPEPTPTPAELRQQYAKAIHRYDYEHDLSRNDIPSVHHRGEADAVLAVRDTELQQLREQLARVARLADEYPVHIDTALVHEALDGQAADDPEKQQLREAIARVHAELISLCREPHPSHDHLCPDDVRRAILNALDPPQDPDQPDSDR